MSGRGGSANRGGGRGGGGDGGRGRGGQPWPGPPSQRGGGRGRGSAPPSVQSPPFPQPSVQPSSSQPPQVIREVGSSSTSTAAAAAASLSAEVEQKLMIQIQPLRPPPESSKSMRFPRRPGYGSVGQKCVVKANHFLVKLQDMPLHHYDVAISPEVTSIGVNRMVMRQLVSQFRESHMGKRKPVYDGRKSLFTAGALPFNSKEFVIKLADSDKKGKGAGRVKDGKGAGRDRDFKVTIKLAAQADLHHLEQFLRGQQPDTPQEVIQILDVVLREVPSNNYTVIGRSFFDEKLGRKSEVGDGLECWRGYYQSLRPTQMGMSLNIDVSATTFYEDLPVIDFVMKYLNPRDISRPLSDADRVKIKKVLRGVKVELTHLENRRIKIVGLSPQSTNETKFDMEGKSMSVAMYFHQKYQIKLQFGHWPSLQAGNDSRPIYLPMELCKIVKGQRYSKKLTDKQVTAMLKAACQRPNDRQRNIEGMVLQNKYEDDEYAKEFGIKVTNSLAVIPGARVLPPPWLQYHNSGKDKRIQPRVGQWNMINARMHEGASVQHWACVTFSQRLRPNDASAFFRELTGMCANKGMVFNPNPVLPMQSARADQIERTLTDLHNQCNRKIASSGGKGQLQLVIIVLPDFSGSYGRIKRVCEIDLGLVSQCCQAKHAGRISPQYLENVALKINVKAGGRNNVLADFLQQRIPLITDVPTIIFGADVTHPQPGEDSTPSIAAVVASMDWPHVTKYRGLVSAQPHRQELIQDLYKVVQDPERGAVNAGMVRELLISFKRSTGQKPHRIIFYRDGVSEGQFSQVLLHEVDAIRKACNSLEAGYLPPITFVVVQKRHHTRLFPNNHGDRNTIDRSGNVLPGTVVDTMICHPSEFDFYLCSHAGIQGTSRPTHYHVLWDENHFTADALQLLTNNLCYTYARCTRSVSIVPPAYYAHLAAFRARYYVENDTSDSESTEARGARRRNAAVRPLPMIKDNVKDVMFYC